MISLILIRFRTVFVLAGTIVVALIWGSPW